MHRTALLVACLTAVSLSACRLNRPHPSADPEKLTLTGSSTVAPLAAEMARRFEQRHPRVRIDVQSGGSSRGIRDAHSGAADVGMSSRQLNPDERRGVTTETIAWDGVTFVVHQSNPVDELSPKQLVGIYTGEIHNWKQVGGRDAPIVVSSRAEGRSELHLITQYLGLQPTQIEADVIDGETQQSIKTVTTNAHAIVYTSVGAAQRAANDGAPLKLLSLGGVPASTTTVQTGSFPLARPLVLIQPSERSNALADEFIRFARSPAVDDLTQGLGYVPPHRDDN